MREMTLGSLFDGAGGFPYAGKAARIKPVWCSEIEPFPIRVTTKQLPEMKHHGNITELDGGALEPVDIITFGSPCQDLSVAGNRKGLAGERSGLFLEAIRIIREMREKTNGQKPEFIVWENVPGAFSSNKGEDFRQVLEEIAKIKDRGVTIPRPDGGKWRGAGEIVGDGYSIAWRTYDAQFWGVPQRRKRIYLVADFGGGRAGKIQFDTDRMHGNPAQGKGQWQATPETAGGYAETSGAAYCLNDQGGERMEVTEGIAGTLRSEMHGNAPIVAVSIDTRHLDDVVRISDKAPTLRERDCKGGNTILTTKPQAITLKERAGCAGGGKGPLWQVEKSATLACHQDQTVFQPVVFGLSSKASNAWQSDNPNSGCYEADTTRTLDTRGGDPTCSQGGMIICQPTVYENHGQDSRVRETGETAPTVSAKYGTGGNNTPIVVQTSYAIGRDCRSVSEEKAQTLTNSDVPGMVVQPYSIGNGQTNIIGLSEVARTLDCMHDAQAVIVPQGQYPYIARRLMPIECGRLQGYPDWWCDGLETENPTEDEIDWWVEVFETHRKAVKPKTKPRTRNQIRKWLKDPRNDSAEYRMWGNSLAIPNAYQVLAGIAEELAARQKETEERLAIEQLKTESEETPMNDIFMIKARKCLRCGRLLTSSDAIQKGYGCQCAQKARAAEREKEPLKGQMTIMDFLKNESEGKNDKDKD